MHQAAQRRVGLLNGGRRRGLGEASGQQQAGKDVSKHEHLLDGNLPAFRERGATLRIAITSCCKLSQVGPRNAWAALAREAPRPDWLLLLGDNVYAGKLQELLLAVGLRTPRAALVPRYERLFRDPGFRAVFRPERVLATWDDHDFGGDDVNGAEAPFRKFRAATRRIFLDYLAGAVQPREEVYCSLALCQDVRVIVTDGRYYRTDPAAADATLLGSAQEEWLLRELAEPERLKIVASGSCLGFDTGKRYDQGWNRYPRWLDTFGNAVRRHHADGKRLLFVAGDLHANRFVNHLRSGAKLPILEVISSGAGRRKHNAIPWSTPLENYGLLDLATTSVTIRLKGSLPEDRFEATLALDPWGG